MENNQWPTTMADIANIGEAAFKEPPNFEMYAGGLSTLADSPESSEGTDLAQGIRTEFGIQQTDPVPATLDYGNFARWIPRFSKPKSSCGYCKERQLECWFTYEGQTSCSACCALFRPCSFTDGIRPDVLMDTLHLIPEDVVQCNGGLTGVKAMRSWDRTPLDHPSAEYAIDDDDRPTRRSTGTRFSRDALKVLKNWVDSHSNNPYPTEAEKEELCTLTGLSVSQVSNWLANTRRRNKRKSTRGASPSIRSGASEAVPIPRSLLRTDQEWTELDPMERWKISPPENEPAKVSDIAKAVANSRVSSNDSSLSRTNSRTNLQSSIDSGSFGRDPALFGGYRAPSITSQETGRSDSHKSSESFSNGSIGSSRGSRGSRNSLHSFGSGQKKERRRRRRATPANNRAMAANERRQFQCTFCTDTFRTKYDWVRHEKSLHLSLEKWICAPIGGVILSPTSGQKVCVYCEEVEPTAEHLETHNHSACEEKGIDSRIFYRKDHLTQHLRLVHGCNFIPSMTNWKAEMLNIKSRCGFCGERFTNWNDRNDHLAKHYKAGVTMKDWKSCRGFEDSVAQFVTNAMPPYLIAMEATTPEPFSATSGTCLSHFTKQTTVKPLGQFEALEQLTWWNQTTECSGTLVPAEEIQALQTDTFNSVEGNLRGLARGMPPKAYELDPSRPPPRISTCWEILTIRLGRYVKELLQSGLQPENITDSMLQSQARWILYESDDDWNQTAADNPEWLELFKKAHGLPSTALDERITMQEDLGAGIGDLSFDTLLQDGFWDEVAFNDQTTTMIPDATTTFMDFTLPTVTSLPTTNPDFNAW